MRKRTDFRRYIVTSAAEIIPLEEVIAEYRRERENGNRHTARAVFLYDLPYFLIYLDQLGIKSPTIQDVNASTVTGYMAERMAANESPATVQRRGATLKSFCHWISDRFPWWPDPSSRIHLPRIDRVPPVPLLPNIVNAMAAKAAEHKDEFPALRNQLIVRLLGDCGLRCSEVIALNASHISGDWLINIHGKGDHFRRLPLPVAVKELLPAWAKVRDERMHKYYRLWYGLSEVEQGHYPLIIRQRAPRVPVADQYRIESKTIWAVINKLGTACGRTDVHPHALRHHFARRLLAKTGNIRLVAKALGHTSLQSTMLYTDPSNEDLVKAFESA